VINKDSKKKLHNIQSLVFMLNLHDEIKIKRIYTSKDIIKFSGAFSKYIKKGDNSVLKSFSLLRSEGYIDDSHNYHVEIKKKIPVFSGLGGGSSNSASIIKHFLKTKRIPRRKLEYFSQKLGSDLKLFFQSSQLYQKDLTNFKNLKKKHAFYFVIIFPFLKCSTKEIYSKVDSYSKSKKTINYNLYSKKKIIRILKKKKNSLEEIVIKKFPIIEKILSELKKINNCEFSRLTGSGSACFGLFLTKKSAELGLKKIKKKFPKYWCVISKTI
tara:strand:+ start:3472 stop:4281 length:810 start_codon:yes stop_codon:yes gene_type:complete